MSRIYPGPQTLFGIMVREAMRVGYPASFTSDLYHDAMALQRLSRDTGRDSREVTTPFLWVAYESGTIFIAEPATLTKAAIGAMLTTLTERSKTAIMFFDGTTIAAVDYDAAMNCGSER